ERVHPEHLIQAVVQAIALATDDHQPVHWEFFFRREGEFTVESDGEHWSVRSSTSMMGNPEVAVTANPESLLAFLKDPETEAPILIEGTPAAKRRFIELTRAFRGSIND
ncbi:MAG TPA: hypothetical protein VH352_05770, partial [Pseudonocardiaceae bacterium]|nr:hypothetical protein [Pseudonocardiaceae bacterium]